MRMSADLDHVYTIDCELKIFSSRLTLSVLKVGLFFLSLRGSTFHFAF